MSGAPLVTSLVTCRGDGCSGKRERKTEPGVRHSSLLTPFASLFFLALFTPHFLRQSGASKEHWHSEWWEWEERIECWPLGRERHSVPPTTLAHFVHSVTSRRWGTGEGMRDKVQVLEVLGGGIALISFTPFIRYGESEASPGPRLFPLRSLYALFAPHSFTSFTSCHGLRPAPLTRRSVAKWSESGTKRGKRRRCHKNGRSLAPKDSIKES